MRGQIWAFDTGAEDPLPLAVVQADVLNRVAPTVVGVVVTSRPQQAGEPLVLALDHQSCGLRSPAWLKVTQVHTVAATDARRQLGSLPPAVIDRLDTALRAVLSLGER